MITQLPHLETERRGAVMILRLNNPEAHNALTREIRYSLRESVRAIEDDHTVRAVYLTGKGPSFCSGGDLRMLAHASDPWPVHRRFRHAAGLFPSLATLNRPVVCGVRGKAIGGGMGMALMADMIVAGTSAQFSGGFFRLGVIPDCLMLFTLPRLIGLARARQFLFGGLTWTAQQAVENGVVLKCVPDDQVDAEGLALAEQLAAGPSDVMGLAKMLMLKSFETSISEMMDYEDLGQALAMSSPEFREGLSALLEKRVPDYVAAVKSAPQNDGLPPSTKPR